MCGDFHSRSTGSSRGVSIGIVTVTSEGYGRVDFVQCVNAEWSAHIVAVHPTSQDATYQTIRIPIGYDVVSTYQ